MHSCSVFELAAEGVDDIVDVHGHPLYMLLLLLVVIGRGWSMWTMGGERGIHCDILLDNQLPM